MGESSQTLLAKIEALTRERDEARAERRATSEVLKVMSRSAFGLQTVLQTLIDSAVRLCATDGVIYLRHGDVFIAEAEYAGPERLKARNRAPRRVDRSSITGRVALSGSVEQIPHNLADAEFTVPVEQRLHNIRALLGVPLLRDSQVEGVFVLGRPEPGLFTQRQIELVQTFADQAVIAIENVRLFDEVQTRTRDLTEALQQQTATADVLKVISRSAFDLKTVLDTLIESAASLCNAEYSFIFLRHGEEYHAEATAGASPEFLNFLREHPQRPGRQTIASRVAVSGAVEHIPDLLADPEYNFPGLDQFSPIRAALGVPLLRDGRVQGIFTLGRSDPEPFTSRQIELVQTFADQAVIAIENVRLFDEVQARTRELTEALQQQTATADVLKVISRSAFNLQTVFQSLIDSAARLCAADRGAISRRDGDLFQIVAGHGQSAAHFAYEQAHPHPLGRGTFHGRAALERATVHVPDIRLDPEYERPEAGIIGNFRAVLAVPIRSAGDIVGVVGLGREAPGPFSPRQIELVETFADQAAIAIENVRLFEKVEARTRELAQSLLELRTAQDRLIQTEKLASLGQLTAGIAHEIKNPLNFVNNFAELSRELVDELDEIIGQFAHSLSDKATAEIGEITGVIKANLDKVTQHGRRADSIVKNMLLHSRQGGGERRAVDLNTIVEESLTLAYHGARAERPGFNITMNKQLDPAVGAIDLYPQEFTRVLLNLISNGFYAAHKKKLDAGDAGFQPKLAVSTMGRPDRVEVRIRDNGTGITDAVKARLFNPFFTTKPAGEGTGLGLSLSRDIIVNQHGGTIEVDTKLGEFTEFTITLPRSGTPLTGAGGRS